MIEDKDLEIFRYFIECYFDSDRDYSELEKAILEMKQMELPKYYTRLLEEAKYIIKLDDWEYIHEFVYKHAFRFYGKDKLVEMIWTIIRVLSE